MLKNDGLTRPINNLSSGIFTLFKMVTIYIVIYGNHGDHGNLLLQKRNKYLKLKECIKFFEVFSSSKDSVSLQQVGMRFLIINCFMLVASFSVIHITDILKTCSLLKKLQKINSQNQYSKNS